MGGHRGSSAPSKEELEVQRMQKEQLAAEKAKAEKIKKEQKALLKVRRSGSQSGLLHGSEEGLSGGYSGLSQLLGG